MAVLCVVAGLAMIGVAFHDLFRTLFHPAGRGALSDWLARGVWRTCRAITRKGWNIITFAGPYAMLAIIAAWVSLIVLGNALIYWRFLGSHFVMAPGLDIHHHSGFFDALNVSIGALITITGDFNTRSKALRFVMGAESLVGFGLLTASVSWLLSIYPVLEHRRSLAQEVSLLHNAEIATNTDVTTIDENDLVTLLVGMSGQMATIRNELSQFPITYYFNMGEKVTAVPGAIAYMYDLSEDCNRSKYSSSVRLAATMLGGGVVDYMKLIAQVFLHVEPDLPTRELILRFAEDHLRKPMPHNEVKWAA